MIISIFFSLPYALVLTCMMVIDVTVKITKPMLINFGCIVIMCHNRSQILLRLMQTFDLCHIIRHKSHYSSNSSFNLFQTFLTLTIGHIISSNADPSKLQDSVKYTCRCNRLRCPLAKMSGLQCFNMGHNGHGINLYGVSMTIMWN